MTSPKKPDAPTEAEGPAWKSCENCRDESGHKHVRTIGNESWTYGFRFPVAQIEALELDIFDQPDLLRCPLCYTFYLFRADDDHSGFMGEQDRYLTRISDEEAYKELESTISKKARRWLEELREKRGKS
ncbi:MAG: hypothetical protein V3R73_01405 [Sphingomonadales bacterium]